MWPQIESNKKRAGILSTFFFFVGDTHGFPLSKTDSVSPQENPGLRKPSGVA